ncbi:DUF6263 family protein [Pseudoflavitalea rhizosphaerae]|uniref:DUF6263 family protein n=1 Tax=Pseudoflavitalea rhizosphaerae TaxID=1884793 RepID=UPI000F8D793B|nr:DUF6263 family protein [Pseudoflavitalea rhizosphaerae]
MTLRSSVSSLLAIVCVSIVMVSCKDASVDLRFVPDDNALYELSYDGSGTGLRNGATEKHTISCVWDLQTSKDSSFTGIKATYKRFKLDALFPKDTLRVDTDHPIPDSIGRNNPALMAPWVWQSVKGLSFGFRMNSLGKIEKMASFTQLQTELAKKILKDSALAQTDRFSTVLDIAASQFNSQAMQDLLQQIFIEFPGRVMKVGDTVGRTYKYSNGLPLVIVQMFKVTEITGTQVAFLMGGSGFLEESSDHSLKVEQQGKLIVNRKTGMLESAYLEEVISGKLDGQPFKQDGTVKAVCRRLN